MRQGRLGARARSPSVILFTLPRLLLLLRLCGWPILRADLVQAQAWNRLRAVLGESARPP
eukprot:8220995-Pyramimonas_sp.AAC.1